MLVSGSFYISISDKLIKDIRHNIILSNIASIISITIFILNVACCILFMFSCHNAVTNDGCNEQTWGEFVCALQKCICSLFVFLVTLQVMKQATILQPYVQDYLK